MNWLYVAYHLKYEKLFTQNVANITFTFETSPNTKPKEKKWGAWHIMSPRLKKWGGNVPRVPHQILHPCLQPTPR